MRREVPESYWRVPPVYWGVVGFARRVLAAVMWFGIASMLAGIALWSQLDTEGALAAVLLAVVLVLPGLIVLHFVFVVRSMMRSATSFRMDGSVRRALTFRMLGWSLLVRPWYWLALAAACLVSVGLIPIGIIAALL